MSGRRASLWTKHTCLHTPDVKPASPDCRGRQDRSISPLLPPLVRLKPWRHQSPACTMPWRVSRLMPQPESTRAYPIQGTPTRQSGSHQFRHDACAGEGLILEARQLITCCRQRQGKKARLPFTHHGRRLHLDATLRAATGPRQRSRVSYATLPVARRPVSRLQELKSRHARCCPVGSLAPLASDAILCVLQQMNLQVVNTRYKISSCIYYAKQAT